MRVISKRRLREFWDKHPPAEEPLKAWWRIVSDRDTQWRHIHEVKAMLTGVDGFNLDCGVPVVVFNIGGNKYRLVARIYYDFGRVYIKAVLTHAQYDTGKWKERICLGQI
jgi:mRNA interferase HigB